MIANDTEEEKANVNRNQHSDIFYFFYINHDLYLFIVFEYTQSVLYNREIKKNNKRNNALHLKCHSLILYNPDKDVGNINCK